jgi:hypothetical protein
MNPSVEPEPSRRFNLLFTEGSGIQGTCRTDLRQMTHHADYKMKYCKFTCFNIARTSYMSGNIPTFQLY